MKQPPKIILDACCGGKTFWFDKNRKDVLYVDIRREEKGLIECRPNFSVDPDEIVDFRDMPYEDNTFKLVIFDPPHLKTLGKKSWTALKYGTLGEFWEEDIKRGFKECMRVLDTYGILIFKWNEYEITSTKIIEVIEHTPLFGHKSGKLSKTHWMCFMKMPF